MKGKCNYVNNVITKSLIMPDRSCIMWRMNPLSREEQTRIVAALVEGNSVRATCRMTGTAKGTILKLLADIGATCAAYQDQHLRSLTCRRVQCDEVWAFCNSKDKNFMAKH